MCLPEAFSYFLYLLKCWGLINGRGITEDFGIFGKEMTARLEAIMVTEFGIYDSYTVPVKR